MTKEREEKRKPKYNLKKLLWKKTILRKKKVVRGKPGNTKRQLQRGEEQKY